MKLKISVRYPFMEQTAKTDIFKQMKKDKYGIYTKIIKLKTPEDIDPNIFTLSKIDERRYLAHTEQCDEFKPLIIFIITLMYELSMSVMNIHFKSIILKLNKFIHRITNKEFVSVKDFQMLDFKIKIKYKNIKDMILSIKTIPERDHVCRI